MQDAVAHPPRAFLRYLSLSLALALSLCLSLYCICSTITNKWICSFVILSIDPKHALHVMHVLYSYLSLSRSLPPPFIAPSFPPSFHPSSLSISFSFIYKSRQIDRYVDRSIPLFLFLHVHTYVNVST